jgi:hypothetical protein
VYLYFLLFIFLSGCLCQRDKHSLEKIAQVQFDHTLTEKILNEFTTAPHPLGSERQNLMGEFLIETLKNRGLSVEAGDFEVSVPREISGESPKVLRGRNIFALSKEDLEKPCLVVLASHYDTKIVKGIDYVGANDSASSSAAIATIMASLADQRWNTMPCGILGVWFDGEEAILPNWNDGKSQYGVIDNTYGSRHLANSLAKCAPDFCVKVFQQLKTLKSVIVLDMVGSKSLSLSLDSHAHPSLEEKLKSAAKFHNLEHVLGPRHQEIEDDHTAFLKLGIPVINLIDFNNIATWHTAQDTLSEISHESIKKSILLGSSLAFLAAAQP